MPIHILYTNQQLVFGKSTIQYKNNMTRQTHRQADRQTDRQTDRQNVRNKKNLFRLATRLFLFATHTLNLKIQLTLAVHTHNQHK